MHKFRCYRNSIILIIIPLSPLPQSLWWINCNPTLIIIGDKSHRIGTNIQQSQKGVRFIMDCSACIGIRINMNSLHNMQKYRAGHICLYECFSLRNTGRIFTKFSADNKPQRGHPKLSLFNILLSVLITCWTYKLVRQQYH
jgi:hypothetical protein